MTAKSTPAKAAPATKTVLRYVHEDGTTVDVDPNRISDVILVERELGRPFRGDATEDLMRLAHMKAGHPGGTSDNAFLTWIDGVVDVEQVTVERPTKAPQTS